MSVGGKRLQRILDMRLHNWTGAGAPSALQSRAMGLEGTEVLHRLGWNVPKEELIHIQEHWLTFLEPPASMHFLLGLVYIGFFLMAIIGNGLVLWIFSSAKSLRTASNMFVVNLAFCDFVMMLKTPIFIYNSFYRGFALGQLGCQIFAFMGSLSGIGAGMTNAFIAYDRYTTITKPFDGKLTRTKAFVFILLIWLYTIPWAVMPLTEVWGRFGPEGFLTACTFDYLTNTFDNKMFVGSIFFCSYCIPMSMIVYFYSKIVSTVFNHEKALREQAKKMNVDSLRSNQNQGSQTAEVRIAKAAITICFLFVASWTPYAVLALIGAFGDQKLLTPGVSMIPACTCKFVACLDPYVYAISHPRYRQELQKRMPWLAINEPAEDTKSVATAATQNNEQEQKA
uniref:Ultraviolet sensitive opsin 1 n=1 Tax=Coccinella septempunctata TaxID=41139 RepID=A0A1P8SFA6_COCSE|nr:ultraviolet sensitive opsin 1 [Coccinella septempunctata]